MPKILLEGYAVDELLDLPNDVWEAIVLRDEAMVFKAGSANLLGKFKRTDDSLIIELAHVDGGGEGALPAVAAAAVAYAKRERLKFVEWRVHAVNCARPNLKLRRVLERRGFSIRQVEEIGECYWLRTPL
jgi:hypothetical protein